MFHGSSFVGGIMQKAGYLSPFFLLLGGCASIDMDSHGHRIVPSDVERMVKCELEGSLTEVARQYPTLTKWGGEYALTLETERKVSAGVTALDWVIPSNENHLSLGFGLSASDRRLDNTVITGSFAYSSTQSEYCSGFAGDVPGFRGRLGMAQWLADSLRSDDDLPSKVGRTVEFEVNLDGAARPGFEITNLTGSGGIGGTHRATHTLVVGFEDITPRPPQRVIIVGGGQNNAGGHNNNGAGRPGHVDSNFLDFLILNNQRDK